ALRGPAIALLVTGIISIVIHGGLMVLRIAVGGAFATGIVPAGDGPKNPEEAGPLILVGVAVDLVCIICAVIVIAGAIKLKNASSYGLGLTAAIIAMLPCSGCCLLGLPFGIWALVVMHRDEVRRAFG